MTAKNIDLSVDFAGVKFKNPFLLSSSPVSNSAEMVAKSFEAGWGGVVYKTLASGRWPIIHPSPRMNPYHHGSTKIVGLQNVEQISDRPLKDNLLDFLYLKKNYPDHPIVASIMGFSTEDWQYLAKSAEDNGADMLELNFSCPHMTIEGSGHKVGQAFALLEGFTEAVKKGLYYPKYTILFIALASEEIGLVGSIQYVAQHKSEMSNIIAVMNLDCIGGENFAVTETYPDHGFDLDGVAMDAAAELGLDVVLEAPGQSDEVPFLSPQDGDYTLTYWWDMSLGISDAHPIGSSILFISSPLLYQEYWTDGAPGWIHTSYDNSTSTERLDWVLPEKLESHIKAIALTVMRVVPSSAVGTDINNDGIVNIVDITIVAKAFGTKPGDDRWNETADVDKNGQVNIIDISMVAKDFGKTA